MRGINAVGRQLLAADYSPHFLDFLYRRGALIVIFDRATPQNKFKKFR